MTHTSTEQQLKDIEQALRLAREAHQHEVDAYRPELYKPECDRRPKYQLDRLGDLICLLQNILYAAQQASRRVQKRGVAQAQQGLDADMFWDADDPEICQKSINNVVVEVDSYRGLKVGDTVTIQRAKRLPDLEVRITMVPDIEGNGDLEWEELAAQATQGMDARDAAFEAVRKAFCKLQRYSFLLDSRGNVRRCADHCGNWVEFDAVHTLFEPQSVDAALAAQAKQGGV